MSDQLKVFSRLAVEQLMDVLKDVLAKEPVPDVPATVLQDLMPANLLQKVWSAILNEPLVQEVKVSIAHLKSFQYELPFMPDRIDYKIGTCCDEIVYNRGLFTPCSKPCKEGNKCRAHKLAPSNFGDYQSRLDTWDNGDGIGKMQVTPDTDPKRIKAFKEVTYGEFCQKAKLSEDIVNKALRDANFLLSVDSRNFVVPVKTRKVRGRPAKKLVEEVHEEVHEDVSLDAEDKSESEKSGDESEVEKVEEIVEEIVEEQEEPDVEEQPKIEEQEPEEQPKVEEKKTKLVRPRIKKPKAVVEPKVSNDGSESESEEPKSRPKPSVKKPKAERPSKVEGSESESESEAEKPKPKPRTKKVKGTALDGAGTSLNVEQFEEE
jgi:hypothetical protein